MSNLIPLTGKASTSFDWNTIQDHNQRAVAKSAVDNYSKDFDKLKAQATKIVEQNTLNLSRCVYTLKVTLGHGDFREVTQQALKLDPNKSAALSSVGKALMQGTIPAEALELLSKMEPRAAAKFIKADDETKNRYVAKYEQTGQVPSQRNFAKPKDEVKNHYVVTFEESAPGPAQTIVDVVATQPPAVSTQTTIIGSTAYQLACRADEIVKMTRQLQRDLLSVPAEDRSLAEHSLKQLDRLISS